MTPAGHQLAQAKASFSKATQNKKLIVALMDKDAKVIEKTVTNPTKKGEARYAMLYGSLGLYQTDRKSVV